MNTALHLVQNDTSALIEQYRDLDRQIKVLEERKKSIGDGLKAGYFSTNKDFIIDGRVLMTKLDVTQERLDTKRLQNEKPDVYGSYLTTISFTQLRLK